MKERTEAEKWLDDQKQNRAFYLRQKAAYERWLAMPETRVIPDSSPERAKLLEACHDDWLGISKIQHTCKELPQNISIWLNTAQYGEKEYWVQNEHGNPAGEHIDYCPYCYAKLSDKQSDVTLTKSDPQSWDFFVRSALPRHEPPVDLTALTGKNSADTCRSLLFEIRRHVTSTPEHWVAFLDFSARMYKLPFTTALLLYAQRPDAVDVQQYENWQALGRHVIQGTPGIPVMMSTEGAWFHTNVFDITDTDGAASTIVLSWKLEAGYESRLVNSLTDSYGISPREDIVDASAELIANQFRRPDIDRMLRSASCMNSTDFIALARKSAEYMVMKRIRPDIRTWEAKDFLHICLLDSTGQVNLLGNSFFPCVRDILRTCETTALEIRMEQQKEERRAKHEYRSNGNPRRALSEHHRTLTGEPQAAWTLWNYVQEVHGGTAPGDTGDAGGRVESDGRLPSGAEGSGGILPPNRGTASPGEPTAEHGQFSGSGGLQSENYGHSKRDDHQKYNREGSDIEPHKELEAASSEAASSISDATKTGHMLHFEPVNFHYPSDSELSGGQTFDAYSWQILEQKQRFISQVMGGRYVGRSAEDIDAAALDYATVKMLSTNDPRVKEREELHVRVAELEQLKAQHQSECYAMEDEVLRRLPERISWNKEHIRHLTADIALQDGNHNEDFEMTLGGTVYRDKQEAGQELLKLARAYRKYDKPLCIGSYRGFDLEVSFSGLFETHSLILCGSTRHRVELGINNIQLLNNELGRFEETIENCRGEIAEAEEQTAALKEQLALPWEYAKEYEEKSEALAKLDIALNLDFGAESGKEQVIDELENQETVQGETPAQEQPEMRL